VHEGTGAKDRRIAHEYLENAETPPVPTQLAKVGVGVHGIIRMRASNHFFAMTRH